MSAATAHDANPYLAGAAAASLLADLRKSTDGGTGDRLSAAIRAVTKAGSTLPTAEVESAIAAIALLLAEYQPALLDGAADEQGLRGWLANVDTELTPGRKLAASAAIGRIALGLNNHWYDEHVDAGTLGAALTALFRLRDALTDSG